MPKINKLMALIYKNKRMNKMDNLIKSGNFTIIKMIKNPIKTFLIIYTISLKKKILN